MKVYDKKTKKLMILVYDGIIFLVYLFLTVGMPTVKRILSIICTLLVANFAIIFVLSLIHKVSFEDELSYWCEAFK